MIQWKRLLFAVSALIIVSLSVVPSVHASSVDVWWPTNSASLSGIVPFQAMMDGMDINSYYMFWEVDNGAYNWMSTSTNNYRHKESDVDVSGWNWQPSGNYTLAFIAQDLSGNEIARTTMQVHVQSNTVNTAPIANPTPVAVAIPTTPSAQNVFTNALLYVNPNNQAAQQAAAVSSYDSYNGGLLKKVAQGATAQWFGDWNSNVASDVNTAVSAATAAGALPVLVAYDIPNRDCGGYSSNGAVNASAYQQWISAFASGIKNRSAVVILEPDATSQTNCLSANDLQTRYSLLSNAVTTLKAAGASVYLDAGHPNWISSSDMASRLQQSGIANADGFALNVSNFDTTADNMAYGTAISTLVGNKHFVIDTSRNGNGSTADNQWCNPSGRAIGSLPTTNTGNILADAFLWIKAPGESDGACNGGPAAGVFWAAYAEGLVLNQK